MTKCLSFALFVFIALESVAGTADTISIYSNSMHRSYNCVVIKPDSYSHKKTYYETVYLLHGYDGYYSNWILRVPQIKKYVDDYQLLIVCPEGKSNSWYFDSPIADSMQFETYIAKEVPEYIDTHFKTIKRSNARAITGLSMGGHGALFLAFRHPDIFGACGSMSGAFDINLFATGKRYHIPELLGDSNFSNRYYDYSVMKAMEVITKDFPRIIIDCGNEDGFIEMNRAIHKKMIELKIPHDYIERPGKHEWKYWSNSLPYHLFYFRMFFDKQKNRVSK
ncbi:MAG: alpha/beta hydrolase family protein [Ferruginibacter sp.]